MNKQVRVTVNDLNVAMATALGKTVTGFKRLKYGEAKSSRLGDQQNMQITYGGDLSTNVYERLS